MKRIGYPVIITTTYIALLLFVFSSDFGLQNSFLSRTGNAVPAVAIEEIDASPSPETQAVKADLTVKEATNAVPAEEVPLNKTPKDGDSPEGAQQ